jgi:epoxyqueuosine reductase
VCQEVCPWNHRAPRSEEAGFLPADDTNPIALAALFDLSDGGFRARFRHTPLWRAKRRGLLRNAAIVLGNQRDPDSLEALARGLEDAEPLVRGAAAWALGRYEEPAAHHALRTRLVREHEPNVRAEIEAALAARAANVAIAFPTSCS